MSSTLAKDPVCGMTVDEGKSKHVSELGGAKYFFCCGRCKAAFDANPQAYAKA